MDRALGAQSCANCGASLEDRRRDARHCSDRCRYESWARKHPRRLSTVSTEPQAPSSKGTVLLDVGRVMGGVRLYVLPEDDATTILANARGELPLPGA